MPAEPADEDDLPPARSGARGGGFEVGERRFTADEGGRG